MDTPAFAARSFARPALHAAALYISIIMISMMTMDRPAHATGNIPASISCSSYTFVNSQSRGEVVFSVPGFPTPGAACAYSGNGYTGYPLGSAFANGSYSCVPSYLWAVCASPVYSCPVNSSGTSTCTCTDPYVPDTTQTSCVLPACPDHASRTIPGAACTCDANYQFDATGTSCVPAAVCPVDKLTTPPFDDACSTSLEKGKGVDVNHACGELTGDMANAAICVAAKINALNIPYTQPSATIRTSAYQNHLLEIWTKSQQLDTIMNSVVYLPEIKQACAPINADINNEKSAHGITHQPSSSGDAAPHVEHRAIDVPEAVAKALMDQVTTYTTTYTIVNGQSIPTQEVASDVEDYMHSAPNACDANLSWGGRFDSYDYVHFQLP